MLLVFSVLVLQSKAGKLKSPPIIRMAFVDAARWAAVSNFCKLISSLTWGR